MATDLLLFLGGGILFHKKEEDTQSRGWAGQAGWTTGSEMARRVFDTLVVCDNITAQKEKKKSLHFDSCSLVGLPISCKM